jgi:hypothetical protein
MIQALRLVPAPSNTLEDDAWDDLLAFIEDRRVIPIGPGRRAINREEISR